MNWDKFNTAKNDEKLTEMMDQGFCFLFDFESQTFQNEKNSFDTIQIETP